MPLSDIISYGTLNFLFFACLLVGVTYAVILLAMGHIGGGDGGDGGHADGGHAVGSDGDGHADVSDAGSDGHFIPGLHLNLTSPMGIATFLTGIGSAGLICVNGFKLSLVWCVIGAGFGGVFLNVTVTYAIFKVFVTSQASSLVRTRELKGIEADVITPIPAEGVGQIAYTTKQGRQTSLARSSGKTAIAKGETVVIEKFVGTTAIVKKQSGDSAEDDKKAGTPPQSS